MQLAWLEPGLAGPSLAGTEGNQTRGTGDFDEASLADERDLLSYGRGNA